MRAGTAAAAFRGKHEALRGDDADPAAAADALEFNPFIGFQVPNAMIKMPEKHAVIAGGHVAAFFPLGQIFTQ